MITASELMTEYWSRQKTPAMIALEWGVSEHKIWYLIKKYDLSKKKHHIKHRGRKDYLMPQHEREKHHIQPHAKKVSMICPKTFKILKTYRSMSAPKADGFARENIRRACRTAGLYKGYLWAFEGYEAGVVRVAQKRGLEKKLKTLSKFKEGYESFKEEVA